MGVGITLQFRFALPYSQQPGWFEQHLDPVIESDLLYWQGMREALETVGDTQSAIYKRAVSITEQHIDPLKTEGPPI